MRRQSMWPGGDSSGAVGVSILSSGEGREFIHPVVGDCGEVDASVSKVSAGPATRPCLRDNIGSDQPINSRPSARSE